MNNLPTDVYTVEQLRELERITIEELGVSDAALMQCAGAAAFACLQAEFPEAKSIAIFCGTGNNGGDGYVLGRLAFAHGLDVVIWQIGDATKLDGVSLEAAQACDQAGVAVHDFEEYQDLNVDVMIDAVLGIGVTGEVKGAARDAIHIMNQSEAAVLSIDIPSGLDADTGCMLGESVYADATITFIGLKRGLHTGHGVDRCGELYFDSLQVPTVVYDHVIPEVQRIHYGQYRSLFLPRQKNTHKGDFGHVLVIGGAPGYSGAVRIAAEAAARIGAGLVSVAYHEQCANVLNARRPEIMAHAVKDAKELQLLLDRADVLVIGPGLGQSDWSKAMLQAALKQVVPKVIDADALNLLANEKDFTDELAVLTPHPGEAARLLGIENDAVQNDRYGAVEQLREKFHAACILKGAGTLIADHSSAISLCYEGNPGMASGGMGDLLSGIIAGLLAQHFDIDTAVQAGVVLHAHAGDDIAREEGERGMLALDLMPEIQKLVNPIH